MASKWVISYLQMEYIRVISYNPLIPTFDPNFQQDIRAYGLLKAPGDSRSQRWDTSGLVGNLSLDGACCDELNMRFWDDLCQ